MSFITDHILTILIFFPVLMAGLVWLMPADQPHAVRRAALLGSLVSLVLAVTAALLYVQELGAKPDADPHAPRSYKLVERHEWIGGGSTEADSEQNWSMLRVQYLVGVDGISLPLLLLTALLTPLAIWASYTAIQTRVKEYYGLLLLLHGAMLGVFCARDLLLFYVFFEFTLIPLYFLIGIWGGSQRRRAADTFFIYTLSGSVLTFAGVLFLGWQAYQHLTDPVTGSRVLTFELDQLYRLAAEGYLSPSIQAVLFFAFFAGFAIKVPLFPFHTWLPLAHTEAPTAGSAILAGILLKLGTYGFLRLSVPMLPEAAVEYAPFIAGLSVIGIIYGALAAWVQTDIKKLVAYSSVSHLGFCLLGMFSLKLAGLTGSLIYMVNHGLSTGALFLLIGMIYERYHTREMSQLGGLARQMPIMAFFLIFFTLSSIGLPGLNGFLGEFLVLLGTFTSGQAVPGSPAAPLGIGYAVLAATGIVLGAIYMLHLCRAVLFGPVREPDAAHATPANHDAPHGPALPKDLSLREVGVLVPLAVCCLWIGVAPKPLFNLMQPPLEQQILSRVTPSLRDWTVNVARPPATAASMADAVAVPAVTGAPEPARDRAAAPPSLSSSATSPKSSANSGDIALNPQPSRSY